MTEANHNANSLNSESNLESFGIEDNQKAQKEEASAADKSSSQSNSLEPTMPRNSNLSEVEPTQTGEQKMNWQKVAHKLREYNRKQLKKVFRLEQELADIDNKFAKYIEKSRSSDVLVAQQEKEIRKYQEEAESFNSQLADLQAVIDEKETTVANLSKQYESAQQQAAQLERDCALLQEDYNHQVYELTTKDREIKELQNKLNQQQRSTLQYKAELQRHQEQSAISTTTIPVKSAIPKGNTYSNQRTIQPWSTSTVAETKITLPRSKSQSIPGKKAIPLETIKTAAQIATWSASQPQEKQSSKASKTIEQPKSSVKVKPKSLAAVDLPTFPRPM